MPRSFENPSGNPSQKEVEEFIGYAAAGRVNAVARYLDRYGGAIIDQESDGFTALGGAAALGRREVVALLLEKGADLERKNADGATPLILSVKGEDRGIVEYLLKTGANIAAKDAQERTALIHARIRRLTEIEALLTDYAGRKKAQEVNAALARMAQGTTREIVHKRPPQFLHRREW